MPQMIFVNLPVTDLEKSIAFYQAVGAVKDERFCDGSAAMMTFSDTISVMLLTHERFSQFTDRRIVDAHTSAQVPAFTVVTRPSCLPCPRPAPCPYPGPGACQYLGLAQVPAYTCAHMPTYAGPKRKPKC